MRRDDGAPIHGVSPTRVLLFIHVPKASGSTLRSVIQRQYPPDALYETRVRQMVDTAPRAIAEALAREGAPDRLRCVMGHMRFGLHRYIEQPVDYITMLRHPVRRIVSHYEYVRRTREHYLHRRVVDGRIPLEEYVTAGLSPELNDGQVRILCGIEDAVSLPYGGVGDDMLEAAERNLRNEFAAVGITERFDESLLLFQRVLGWGSVHYEPENVAPRGRTPRISQSTIDGIMRYNALDLRLYEYACEMLDSALVAHGVDARAVTLFKARTAGRRARHLTARLFGLGSRRR